MYWRQFADWVTDLDSKYRHDIFIKTEVNVIALQVLFAAILSIVVALAFNYFYKDILQSVLDEITKSIAQTGTFTASQILDATYVMKAKNFLGFFVITLLVTIGFSYVIARTTLIPARNALKSQKRFVSDIAHELRTPLAIIKTNIEVALLEKKLEPKVRRIFKGSVEDLDRASAIINNLLTFNKLVHPEQIRFTTVNMSEVVDNAIIKLDEFIKTKDIELVVKKIRPYSVWGNVVALEQIVVNVIKNAVNYTQQGELITVMIEPDYKGHVLLTVRDNGIGISQEDLVHIFEPFYRAERSRNRQLGSSSSGLGLTIVSELVKLHLGKINVSSRLKYGTTVTISLPYSKTQPIHSDHEMMTTGNEVSIDFLKGK